MDLFVHKPNLTTRWGVNHAAWLDIVAPYNGYFIFTLLFKSTRIEWYLHRNLTEAPTTVSELGAGLVKKEPELDYILVPLIGDH